MFQRAYLTAQNFGVAEKAHDAMFDAVWKTGELAIVDPITGHLKYPLPTLEDAARFYHRATGVSASDFVASANSMGVITQIEQADTMVMRYRIDGTPAIIVNGRYRISTKSAGGYDQLIALVKWLVAKESH